MRKDRNVKKVSHGKIDSFLNRRVSFEGTILLAINFADTFQTAFSIELGLAVELNPVMKMFLEHGIPTFVAGRIAIFGPLILALELLRSTGENMRFAKFSQWVAIITYPLLILLANLLFPYLKILWRLG